MKTIHTVYDKLYMSQGEETWLSPEEIDILLKYLNNSMFYNPLIDLDSEICND